LISAERLIGGPDEAGRFSKEALRQDWGVLRCALETYHAGLYLFTSKDHYDLFFDNVHTGLDLDMTELEFFSLVAMAAAHSGERHTRVGQSVQDDESGLMRAFDDDAALFPVKIKIIDGRIFAWEDATGLVPQGREILHINGAGAAQTLETLSRYVASNGFIEASRHHDMERDFRHYYYWYIDQPQRFVLALQAPDGSQEIVDVNATPLSTIKNKLSNDDKRDPLYDLSFDSDGTAILRMSSFNRKAFAAENTRPATLFDGWFRELRARRTPHLIVDLRDNPGGHRDDMRQLLAYLVKGYPRGRMATSMSWDGRFRSKSLPLRSARAFKEQLTILVNGGTQSVAAELASLARQHARATIVGIESGGRYDGGCSGTPYAVRLPNTRIRMNIPSWRTDLRVPAAKHGRGVLPDHIVTRDIEDMMAGVDTQLNHARELFAQSRQTQTSPSEVHDE
jgi:hypothetical protein